MSSCQFLKIFSLSLILSLFCFFTYSQYAYPVGVLQVEGNSSYICVIHQKNINQLELWFWDPIENKKIKGLSSQFNPAGFTLLPSQKSFSFIDQGRIRVKEFAKRSTKALDVYEPIYNFGFPCWVNDMQCVVSAQKGRRTGLFLLDKQGNVKTILHSENTDALYPQKAGDMLFYVENTQENSKIIYTPYPKYAHTKVFDLDDVDSILSAEEAWKTPLINNEEKKVLCQSYKKKIIFLQAKSKEELFFIEHDEKIEKREDKIGVNYCYASQKNGSWVKKVLFSFSLPLTLLSHSNPLSLYESIIPLLPYHNKKKIYYSDMVERLDGSGLDLFSYDQENKTITSVACGKGNQNFFSPIMFHEKLFFGSSCNENSSFNIFS